MLFPFQTVSFSGGLVLIVFYDHETFVYEFSRQEGWRLENENPTDSNSPLVFKGVVFNEMKGAFVSK